MHFCNESFFNKKNLSLSPSLSSENFSTNTLIFYGSRDTPLIFCLAPDPSQEMNLEPCVNPALYQMGSVASCRRRIAYMEEFLFMNDLVKATSHMIVLQFMRFVALSSVASSFFCNCFKIVQASLPGVQYGTPGFFL